MKSPACRHVKVEGECVHLAVYHERDFPSSRRVPIRQSTVAQFILPAMLRNLLLLALASFALSQDAPPTNASATDDEMGPAAFMWPPDRVWSGDVDNRPPCGSRASAGNRTEFPLSASIHYLISSFRKLLLHIMLLTCGYSWWCHISCCSRRLL